MRLANNSYITEETIAYYNYLIKKIYNIEPSMISKITTDRLYKVFNSWANAHFSNRSHLNNIAMYDFNMYVEFIKNSCDFVSVFGTNIRDTNSITSDSIIFNLNDEKNVFLNGVGSNGYESLKRGEIRVPVPEGFNGNRAFVEFLIPSSVVFGLSFHELPDFSTALTSPADDQIFGASLLYNLPVGGDYNPFETGVFRENALFFYSHFVKGDDTSGGTTAAARIKIVANKFSDNIVIEYSTGEMVNPFDEEGTIPPLVMAKITYIKSGV